jgi:hypothetical protein
VDDTPAAPTEDPSGGPAASSAPGGGASMPDSPWAPGTEPEAESGDGRVAAEAATTQPLGGGPMGPRHRRRGKGTWILVTAAVVAAALVAGGLILSASDDGNGSASPGATPSAATSLPPVTAPGSLEAKAVTVPLGVRLTWSPSATADQGYRVFRDDTQIATVASTETTYTDANAGVGQTYTYGVAGLGSGGRESDPVTVGVDVPVPPLSKARLDGSFTVKVKVTSASGYTDYAKRFTIGWDFTPKCRQGPCNVRWKDLSDKDFRATLKRKGATYKGSDSGPLNAKCGDTVVTSTVDISFKVVKAKAVEGAWTATKITGTMVQAEEAQLGCVATRLDQTITGTLLS